jgi:uncharacterized protein GlcG (DUF336 family)
MSGEVVAAVSAVVNRPSISNAAVRHVLRAGRAQAEALGLVVSIAVVDQGGVLMGFIRLDGASIGSVDVAIDKAFTVVSAGFGVGTGELFNFVKDDASLVVGLAARGRNAFIGGGSPLTVDGVLVGAVGVAGGHYSDDMKVAEAAVAGIAAM